MEEEPMRITQKYLTKAKLALMSAESLYKEELYPLYIFNFSSEFKVIFCSFNLKERVKQLACLFYIEDKYSWMFRDREQYKGYDLDYYSKTISLRHCAKNLATEARTADGLITLAKIYEQHRKQ